MLAPKVAPLVPPATSLRLIRATPYTAKIGIELDGIGDGGRSKQFVDVVKTLRPWTPLAGDTPVPLDANGWPQSDAQTVFFDIRPFGAWWGEDKIDDPDRFQPDWSGTYHLSFKGQATLRTGDPSQATLANQRYDAATNTTTAEVTVPKGGGLLVMVFAATQRTPESAKGSGVTDMKFIRPGYPADTKQLFTSEFLESLKPFSTLRFMDWTNTNANPGYYGDVGHHTLQWADRHLPTDATQQGYGTKVGASWEYAIQLANATGKDMWINVPVAASDDYVLRLALLLKSTLQPGRKIYIEHSNEVWNFGFPQYIYNKLAAVDEVGQGKSPLNNDGATDQETWAHRRHAKRLVEIGNIFRVVYGDAAMGTRILPVYASWSISPDAHYAQVLDWVNKTYGSPKKFFSAVAGAAYYNGNEAGATASVDDILASMKANSDKNLENRAAIQKIADAYGLKHFQYEIGPDTGGGSEVNVANRIRANRDLRIKEVLLHDATDNWFAKGGDLYMYFAHLGGYSRYGAWGLSEDVMNLDTPKWGAIYQMTGYGIAKK